MIDSSGDKHDDLAGLTIPRRAYAITTLSIALAGLALLVMPGPASEGCTGGEVCFPLPNAPLWVAAFVLLVGAALSTRGSVPRQWVIEWSAARAGLAALLLVGLPLSFQLPATVEAADRDYRFALAWISSVGSFFAFMWIAEIAVNFVTSTLRPPVQRRLTAVDIGPDGRPTWVREATSALAALHGRADEPLRADERQLAAEVAFTMGRDPDAPALVRRIADDIRAKLGRDTEATGARRELVEALGKIVNAAPATPYR